MGVGGGSGRRCVIRYEAGSNCVSEGDGKREGLRMMTIIRVADMITK